MIKSLGPGLDTTDFIRIALGSQHTFIVVQNSNLSKPLVISWPQLLQQIQNQITVQSSGTIEVQDEGTIIDATAQFLNFVGAGVTVTQNGNGVDITIPGGGGGSAAWGSITGTITNQTDLVAYVAAQIAAALVNYVPNTRTLTINGVTYDLSANRTWNVGTVTSVGATAPITSSGGATPTISTSMNTNKLIGRGTAGVGVMEEITLGTNLSLSGTTLNATGGGGIPHGTASGTDTYTVTISGVASYADGDAYLIRFPNGNTTGATININGLGAISLYRNNDGPVIGGDIQANSEMLLVYNSTTTVFQCIGTSPNTIIAYVTNDDTVTITKGQAVYAFGGTGDRMTVKLANNSSDATSAQTVGLVFSTSIAANQKGFIMLQGLLDGLSTLPTSTWADGDPVYLGATAGSITKTKPYAPNHLVYLGVVTTASPGAAGRMYVKVQNGYELDELHNVQAQTPSVNDVLYYFGGSPGQWKTASIASVLGYTPVTNARTITINGNTQDLSADRTWSVGTVTSVSASVPSPASPALSVAVSNPTTTPAIAITANGTSSQYVRGDGSLAPFPTGIPVIYKSTTDGTGITGVATEQISASQLIPANVFTVGDIIRITWRFRKTGTASVPTTKLYVNITNSISGAAQLMVWNAGFTNSFTNQAQRTLAIKSATNTEVFPPSVTTPNEYQSVAVAVTAANINWTVDQYLIFMCQLSTGSADVVRTSFYLIEKV